MALTVLLMSCVGPLSGWSPSEEFPFGAWVRISTPAQLASYGPGGTLKYMHTTSLSGLAAVPV
jgi:hypothetical protein